MLPLYAFALLSPVPARPLCDSPIDVHNNHVFVPVGARGKTKLWFLLDSGAAASLNIMDTKRAAALGIKAEGSGSANAIGGKTKIQFTPPVGLAIASFKLPTAKLALMDLSAGEAEEGHRVDGMLGYSLFQQYGVQIDYPRKRLRLYDRKATSFGPRLAALPLAVRNKNCLITADIALKRNAAPVRMRLIVDTGYDETLILTSPFVRKHNLSVSKSNSGTGLGGSTSSSNITIPTVRLGGFWLSGVRARASLDKEGAFSSSSVDGYIGGGLLKRFVVTFDYAHGRLILARP